MNILELGCGYGEHLKTFKGHKLYGVDKDIDRLREANKHGIKTTYADLDEYMPLYKDKFFDMVIMNHTIEHLKNLETVFTMIQRFLKDEGIFVINTPNLACWHNRFLLLFGQQPNYTKDEGHLKLYTFSHLKEELRRYGWKVIYWETKPNKRGNLLDILDNFFSFFQMGSNLNVICKKKIQDRACIA